ncbi:MAG: hypothetical protein R2827_08855 [Bdellovibrionales bacterium]
MSLSVASLSVIIERFLPLLRFAKTQTSHERIREIVKTNDKNKVNSLSEDWNTLEGRALDYGLRHIKKTELTELEDFFDLR